MTKTWCVGRRRYSKTNNITVYEKKIPKTKKLLKVINETCSICGRNKSQNFTNLMTRGEIFTRKGKSKNIHCSSMSNSAWFDLTTKGEILKLYDNCSNPKCNCQRMITFTPHQYMLEDGSIKSKLQKILRGTKKAWDSFIKPGLKLATPLISAAVAAKNTECSISSNDE